MFLKRPKQFETENELLRMQQNFLKTGSHELSNTILKASETAHEGLLPKQKSNIKIKKTSLFAQKMHDAEKKTKGTEDLKPDNNVDNISTNTIITKEELSDIHSKQLTPSTLSNEQSTAFQVKNDDSLFEKIISEHSVEELLEEMKQYQKNPDVLSILKKRRKNKQNICDSSSNKSACHENAADKSYAAINSDENSNKKISTRFGLHGEIIMDETRSYGSEFYHHEEEPERGGYTLQEIFLLARSSLNRQQDFALKLLSCIVKQAKLGSFHGKISSAVIPVLLGGDVGFMARLALDSNAQSVIISAIEFLHALLVNSEDEAALDHTFTWHRGYEQPIMNATDENFNDEINNDDDENKMVGDESLKVEDVIKKDLVEGLLRMVLLPRISYLLTFLKDQRGMVNDMLDIIIRISRHRNLNCDELKYPLDYPQWLDTVVKEFLPLQKDGPDSNTKESFSRVIRLLRMISSSDVEIAKDVLEKYGGNVFQHIHEDATQNSLYYEALRFLVVLLRYGLAKDEFIKNISFIVTRLSTFSESPDVMYNNNNTTEISLLLAVVEAGISLLHDYQFTPKTDDNNVLCQELSQLVKLCITICKNHTDEFLSRYYMQKYTVSSVLTSSLNCVATCFHKFSKSLHVEAADFLASVLDPCLNSTSFDRSTIFLRENSSIIPDATLLESLGESSVSFKTLQSLWADQSYIPSSSSTDKPSTNKLVSSLLKVHQVSHIFPQKLPSEKISDHLLSPSPLSPSSIKWHPVLHPLSTSSFLVALARTVLVVSKLCGDEMLLKKFLTNPEVHRYLLKLVAIQNPSDLNRSWFSRYETHFAYLLVNMAKHNLERCSDVGFDSIFYHKIAMNLITILHRGDEAVASHLISKVIFNKEFFKDVFIDEKNFQNTFIVDTKRSALLDFGKDILNNLSNISDSFVQLFFNEEDLRCSRNFLDGRGMKCMMIGRCDGLIMERDWLFEPLKHLYSLRNQSRRDHDLHLVTKKVEELCVHSIRAILLFEKTRPEVLLQIPLQLKFTRLVQAVITAEDNDAMYPYMDQLVETYARIQNKSITAKLVFPKELYDSFLNVYLEFLVGAPTYDVMVLLPLVLFDDESDSLWQLVWSRHPKVARYLFLPFNQLPFNPEVLLKPKDENNIPFIKTLYQFLRMNWLTHSKTPIPYLVAIHNLNHFIFSSGITSSSDESEANQAEEAETYKRMFAREVNNLTEPLRTHVLLYKHMNLKCNMGFELYESLPTLRQKRFTMLTGTEV